MVSPSGGIFVVPFQNPNTFHWISVPRLLSREVGESLWRRRHGVLRGKKDQEEGGKKRPKTEVAQPDPTRPTCTEPKPNFFSISHHLIRVYSDLGTWLTHSIVPYYRKIPISLVKGTLEDSIKFWKVYDHVSNHLEQVFK